jgi:hypothetical protein
MRLPNGYESAGSYLTQGKSCEFSRAIGDHNSRAIGDRILVLSGTRIALNALAHNIFSTS